MWTQRVAAVCLVAATGTTAWWRDEDPLTRGDPPYPYPASHADGTAPVYETRNEKDGPVEGKINVHLVPHTHDDTGWQVTVDQYFFSEVYYIVDTVVDQLLKDPKRHFIYVETGFFARWWDEQPDERRNVTRGLVTSGQLEFINGAWCMHDEASPIYVEMIDQTTRGHQFLKKNFGDSAIPRGTWQIDPFGHSNTQAWLLSAEAGMESLYWGRTDYQDIDWRTSYAGQSRNQWPEWIWQGSQSLGNSAEVFAGELTSGGYGAPIDWHDQGGAIQDNPSRHDYNLDMVVDSFIHSALQLQNITKLNHQMWPCGDDFEYQNADLWFHNLDKIIHYVNYNASIGGRVVAFYSTPSHYTDMKHRVSMTASTKWEVRSDDIFPLGDDAHSYWSGYFTSRPSLKRQVRFATNFLNAARQMEAVTGITADQVGTPTTRPSPPVGESWTDSFEGAIGVATHHDGMSGTERQDVADDYSQRISEGHFEVEAGVELALKKLTRVAGEIGHCNCNSAGNCLNMSMCTYTTGVDEFTVIAWNPLGQNTSTWLRIPVSGANYTVTDLATHATLSNQVTIIDSRTKELPLLYLNKYKMEPSEVTKAQVALANNATHVLTFDAALPPIGYSSFSVVKTSAALTSALSAPVKHSTTSTSEIVVNNNVYSITVNTTSGYVSKIRNVASGVESALNITWGYYVSNEGDRVSDQASGAYMFRPAGGFTHSCSASKPSVEVTSGPLISEITQTFADWATHTIRLTKDSPFIEIEWTAGPIPTLAPPQPPPPPPMPVNLTGQWNVMNGDALATLVEMEGGVFTVSDPKGDGWKSATGTINGHHVSVFIDNGATNDGTIAPDNSNIKWTDGTMWSRQGAGNAPGHLGGGKEVVLQVNSAIRSRSTFYTDSNGREMVKRVRNARGPSYPKYVIGEPVAGNYYPVNSMISLDDGKTELAMVVDTTMGGSSMSDGSLEVMVHRRCLHDDGRGVQEPLNETMCGCNDIGAAPGNMGAHGHEGDGGCDCDGLTVRGSVYIVFDNIQTAHKTRRELVERLNFGPTLGFTKELPKVPVWSSIIGALPPNVKLMTVMSSYRKWNKGQLIFRFAHMYAVEEHATLSQPVSFSLTSIFGKAGLKVVNATETMLTANQPRKAWEAHKKNWSTVEVVDRGVSLSPQVGARQWLDETDPALMVTLNAMEVKTFLVTIAAPRHFE